MLCGFGLVWGLTSCKVSRDSNVLQDFPHVSEKAQKGYFLLAGKTETAVICFDEQDADVVKITAGMLADDIERVTSKRPETAALANLSDCTNTNIVVAGTVGHNRLIDSLVAAGKLDAEAIEGQWEAFTISTLSEEGKRLLIVAGSDRRGTAFGLTSLSRAIGVSPWYWWADVTPQHKAQLSVEAGRYISESPSVQYRGFFINDERFGGWAKWVEQTFDKESGKVGPKVYERVFELLLRLRANYLWPAMHPGTQAFNADPENARLADKYAIVMGSSHCEQLLRNNEGEWKAVGTYGDFNYITNRQTMQDYWEERLKTNGTYENTYTLGLRGIHDYPMEGAQTTEQRVALMQQAINDQRMLISRNIDRPLEEIPQILCTYEEVLEAYHNGLQVPEDVILLWSDDKQGFTRNLCNPDEMKRKGGAGIYYHLSYHGDPASWIWLSPLSPAFVSTEMTKAYEYGAQRVWIFNVGDIKPAEKEISFAMDLAWNLRAWAPERAHDYIYVWAEETFGKAVAKEIAAIQAEYYRLMAAGKDAHVWFVEYPETEIYDRMAAWQKIAEQAEKLRAKIAPELQDAYFELVLYPVKGAQMLNEMQLLSRLSMRHATVGDSRANDEGQKVPELYAALNEWTRIYNEEIQNGKWGKFFSWIPYHWYYSTGLEAPYSTPELTETLRNTPAPQDVNVRDAISEEGALVMSDKAGRTDMWIRAISPVRNFSKLPEDNVIGQVDCGNQHFTASATPINNVWHSPYVGPMWSKVGSLELQEGENRIRLSQVPTDARIDSIYLGTYPPFPAAHKQVFAAKDYVDHHDTDCAAIRVIEGLGYCDGVTTMPQQTPSYEPSEAPYVTYSTELHEGECSIEIRTLPTLHVYEGRDIRFAVSLDDNAPEIFSIHEGDFTAEWRRNVLRGYATRTITAHVDKAGKHQVRVYLLDPGMVLEEVRIYE